MSDQKKVGTIPFDMTQLTQENAVKWVIQCEKTPIDALWKNLSAYVSQLKIASSLNTLDVLESFVHVVYKGFYHKSEIANGLRYFYWGYFAREQEEILRNASKDCKAKALSIVSSKKYFSDIIYYLYTNGCSQQRDIVNYLGVDKSNLSRLLQNLVNCGLIIKMSGPKSVFYELTQEGYNYFKQHEMTQHYSISVSKKDPRLESEAMQIREELIHAEGGNFNHSYVQRSLPISKFYFRVISEMDIPEKAISSYSVELNSSSLIGDKLTRQHKINHYQEKSKYISRNGALINSR